MWYLRRLSMEGQKALRFHKKIFCYEDVKEMYHVLTRSNFAVRCIGFKVS